MTSGDPDTLCEVSDGWVPLTQFGAQEKPTKVRLPDGFVAEVKSWAGLLWEVADYLSGEGLFDVRDCPVRLGNASVAIIDTVGVRLIGEERRKCHALSNGTYLYTKYSKSRVWSTAVHYRAGSA